MPLPIAHSAAGLGGYLATRKFPDETFFKDEAKLLGICLLLANLPDFDFIPGLFVGDPSRFHHGPSHSLWVCLSVSSMVFLMLRNRLGEISNGRILVCCLVSLLSHPILDYFSLDTSEPFGVPLLWPFDSSYYISPLLLFFDVHRQGHTISIFLKSLINTHNSWAILTESLFSAAILLALFGSRVFSRRLRPFPPYILSAIFALLYLLLRMKPSLISF